ncbi:MAG: hypothetical protein CMJ46_12295 [Planctomyces sp.]|nr:hypothetical protein [Planctomyces sp.]
MMRQEIATKAVKATRLTAKGVCLLTSRELGVFLTRTKNLRQFLFSIELYRDSIPKRFSA